ncbi:F-box domain-containing protein [Blastomyces dermatitidis ER-3]|uniref:F-box domain-containing protein n=6 Tax=Blastomyces TaxID=229219 RepID=A0A179UM03_BLAGS|nr:F-box domain-containing protein [Blastomyces gilchristii SLH14081]XP_045279802.1 F-box domain-containing protein [Blastomyces dermatitidis ER-3]EGE82712.2 F-box domain-containing protein [Blastomyces dermatitidis ATCC 18188]OAT00075.1 F-box domain-containing protein [Blastomyces dermatitidis ER-3]OAT08041.1 F-box domain-containing protein [Blastomyces gilchristii SLH14081]
MPQGDANSLQVYGQSQYRYGNFHRALAAFSQALKIGGGDTVGILDNRAATHCKLKAPNAGLQDGRRMIEENKTDSRGYLRTAKILQLMDKHERALQTYHYALRILPSDDAGRQQIKKLAAKLEKRFKQPIDYFALLPFELMSMILEYLDLKSLLSALRVSKHWNMVLNSLPKLWTHLDLSKANRPISLKSIQVFLRRSHWRLTRASIANLQSVDFPKLMAGLQKIPSLEHLELLPGFYPKFEFAPVYTLTSLRTLVCSATSEMTFSDFMKVLSDCPLLERVEVHIKPAPPSDYEVFPAKLPNLRSLIVLGCRHYRHPHDVSPLDLPFLRNATLFDITPNLEELYLIHRSCSTTLRMSDVPKISNLPKLKRLGLLGIKFNNYPKLPESIEHLSLSMSEYDPPIILPSNTISAMTPNLKSLILQRFQYDELGTFLIALTQSKPSLTNLDLEGCHLHVEDLLIAMMQGNLENLMSLNISGLAEIDDKIITNIIDMVPNIKELDISRTQVKEHSVKRLLDCDKLKLEKLVIHKMETPFSRDFIDYARSKGVEIPPPINLEGRKRVPIPPASPRR